jgi:hypothetical protein
MSYSVDNGNEYVVLAEATCEGGTYQEIREAAEAALLPFLNDGELPWLLGGEKQVVIEPAEARGTIVTYGGEVQAVIFRARCLLVVSPPP